MFSRLLNGSNGCSDVLSCVYELNTLETAAYFALLEDKGARMEALADELDRDRSTVYRAVQKLMNLHLVQRETIPLDGGGYCYEYQATDPTQVRDRIEERLAKLQEAVRDGLDSFEQEARQLQAEATDGRVK